MRILVDPEPELHRFLKGFAFEREAKGTEVMRALLEMLRQDPDLAEELGRRLGESWGRRALKENERRFRSSVASSEVARLREPDGALHYASPAFRRLFGYDPEEATGTNILDYAPRWSPVRRRGD